MRVLFVAYFFPPAGGAGVQRTVKFLKCLGQYGVEADVVAGDGAVVASLGSDSTLEAECGGARVTRVQARGMERPLKALAGIRGGAWAPWFVEGLRWWRNAAVRTAREVMRAARPDVIYVTASPFEAAAAGRALSRESGIPWALDLRDPWALDPTHTYPTYYHYLRARAAMREACASAAAVIMNTPRAAERLKEEFNDIAAEKVFCIPNGYDEDDLPPREAGEVGRKHGPLVIAHAGVFHTGYALKVDWRTRQALGSGGRRWTDMIRYRPGEAHLLARTPYYLFGGVRKAIDAGETGRGDIRMVFAGAAGPEDRALAGRFGLEASVEWTGYLAHVEAVKRLSDADVLFVPLHTVAGGTPLIVPGKTYECMGLRKPILACVPEGDARDVLAESGLAVVCEPTDVGAIASAVAGFVRRHKAGEMKVTANEDFIRQFERRKLAARLAKVLEAAAGGGHKGAGREGSKWN